MWGPCGPRKTLPGAPVAFFGTPKPTVYLVQDLAYGYLIAGHIIWHGHFFEILVLQQSPS